MLLLWVFGLLSAGESAAALITCDLSLHDPYLLQTEYVKFPCKPTLNSVMTLRHCYARKLDVAA